MAELTLLDEKFCHAYVLNGGNAADAYKEAIPDSDQYADKTIYNKVCIIAQRPEIVLRVMEIRADLREKLNITRERIVEELIPLAFANTSDYLEVEEDVLGNQSVKIKTWNKISRRKLAAVSEVKQVLTQAGSSIVIKFHSKLAALEQLAKICDLMPKEGSGTVHNYVIVAPEQERDVQAWLARAQREQREIADRNAALVVEYEEVAKE